MNETVIKLPPQPFAPNVADAPTIRVAGRDWPVPELAVKQLRIVIPALLKLNPLMIRMQEVAGEALKAVDAAKLENRELSARDLRWIDRIALSTEDFDLLCDVVFLGITRGTPGFSRAEFDNMPVSTEDLLSALPVVAEQSRGVRREPTGGKPVGESAAGGNSTSI